MALGLIGLAINKARAGEQTRFYGADGRSIGTATTSGNTTTFYGADGQRTGSATTSGNTTTLYGADGRSAFYDPQALFGCLNASGKFSVGVGTINEQSRHCVSSLAKPS
jgi:hypothetical protein